MDKYELNKNENSTAKAEALELALRVSAEVTFSTKLCYYRKHNMSVFFSTHL